MKKYRVYGVHVASNKAWDESVYDEVIRANSPQDATRQAIQWNIEESISGEFDAKRNMIIYRDIFGGIDYILTQFYAVELN